MEVVIPEIVDGVVINAGPSALEERAAVRKHARTTNPRAEFSLRRRKTPVWRLSSLGSMGHCVIFIRSFGVLDLNEFSIPRDSAFMPTNGHQLKRLIRSMLFHCVKPGDGTKFWTIE